jgi:hypothetical protein
LRTGAGATTGAGAITGAGAMTGAGAAAVEAITAFFFHAAGLSKFLLLGAGRLLGNVLPSKF